MTEGQADRVRAWFGSVSREEAGYLTYVRGCYLTRRDAEQRRESVSADGTGEPEVVIDAGFLIDVVPQWADL